MSIALFLALAQPATATAAEAVPVCSLVTPRGDAIGFFIGGDDAPGQIRLSATPGSAWPTATLQASRLRAANLRFAIGGARDGLLLELGNQSAGQSRRPATLFLRDGDRVTVPVAYGFCEDRPVTANAPEPAPNAASGAADGPAFNPALWPEEDCALILSNGRRMRFDFTLTGENQLRLDSRDLWSGRSVSTSIRWLEPRESVQLGAFGRDGGPEGLQMMFVAQPMAAKLVRFAKLGDPSLPNVTGYGICGYRTVTRRPSIQ
jgi:hypothetical protein